MKSEVLFDDGSRKVVIIGRDAGKNKEVIDTNELAIIDDDAALLIDPGGIEIFPKALTELTKFVSTKNVKTIVATHQDPDIASSLALWTDLCPGVEVRCSWLWKGFLAHFGMGSKLNLISMPDEGGELKVGSGKPIRLLPAHFCHSPGNFSIFDPVSNILCSGDIGAALLPAGVSDFFVKDFDKHVGYMEGFHKRWMPSSKHLHDWVARVREINPTIIAPQHGSVFQGENVARFLDWLESLEVGIYEA